MKHWLDRHGLGLALGISLTVYLAAMWLAEWVPATAAGLVFMWELFRSFREDRL